MVGGAALDDRDEALAALRTQLLVGGPLALLLASLAGYALAGAALRPVEAMRRRADGDLRDDAGRPAARPAARDDEIARLARTLNEMLGAARSGHRARARASSPTRATSCARRSRSSRRSSSWRCGGRAIADELRPRSPSAAEETDRLVRLADDLLVLAPADEGQLRLTDRADAASRPARDRRRRFAARAADASRDAARSMRRPELRGRGDRLRLEQALGNLVDNALRYGAGTVRLEARRGNDSVELRVSDDGAGLPARLPRRSAFERFSRADEPRVRGAAGLGLALVEAIARAHGGRASAANGRAAERSSPSCCLASPPAGVVEGAEPPEREPLHQGVPQRGRLRGADDDPGVRELGEAPQDERRAGAAADDGQLVDRLRPAQLSTTLATAAATDSTIDRAMTALAGARVEARRGTHLVTHALRREEALAEHVEDRRLRHVRRPARAVADRVVAPLCRAALEQPEPGHVLQEAVAAGGAALVREVRRARGSSRCPAPSRSTPTRNHVPAETKARRPPSGLAAKAHAVSCAATRCTGTSR